MDNVIIYKPNQRAERGFLSTWRIMFGNVFKSRELIYQLFRRDFVMQYRKSFLGLGWVLISPIVGVVSWIILNSAGVLQSGDVGVPFPAYVLVGTTIWGLFIGLYQASSETLSAGRGFINQVSFPHEALLFKQSAQYLANFVLIFLINIIALLVLQVTPSIAIILLPIFLLPIFFLSAAIGLVLSLIKVIAQDVTNAMLIILNLFMYLTPVIYAPGTGSELLQTINQYNPLTYLITVPRDIVFGNEITVWPEYFLVSGVSMLLFFISWRLFYLAEDKIIERMV
jgi:lipopolysaccharide transport system permease protein